MGRRSSQLKVFYEGNLGENYGDSLLNTLNY